MTLSIIICSYNPNFEKLLLSVKSAVCQEGIDFEVIITDDGSKQNYRREIENYLNNIQFNNYLFIEHKNNIGTVKNVLYAVKQAKGEYIFLNSPGDYIYDKDALAGFCAFAKEKNADICFGDYVAYNKDDNNGIHIIDYVRPLRPSIYERSIEEYTIYHFFNGDILGASYLRRRSFLLESLEFVSKYSKYVEDGTTTAYGLLNEIPVFHFCQRIVWYEFGTGICTSGSGAELINKDYLSTNKALLKKYPNSRVLMARVHSSEYHNKNIWARRLTTFLHFPIISIRIMMFRLVPKKEVCVDSIPVDYFEDFVDIKRDVELCK